MVYRCRYIHTVFAYIYIEISIYCTWDTHPPMQVLSCIQTLHLMVSKVDFGGPDCWKLDVEPVATANVMFPARSFGP